MAWKVITEPPVGYSSVALSFTTTEPILDVVYPAHAPYLQVTKEANLPPEHVALGIHYKLMLAPYSPERPSSPV